MRRDFMKIVGLAAVGMFAVCSAVSADQAILVEEAVLVETNPKPDEPVFRASYITSDGWSVTSPRFIDVATMVFDFGTTGSVSQAVVSLPLEEIFPRSGAAPLRVYAFADDGKIDLYDYKAGSPIPVADFDAVAASGGNHSAVITLNVTGAVNAILPTSRYVGFRVQSTAVPADVSAEFPAWTGVKFRPFYSLEFSAGTPAPVPTDRPRFDGFTLSVPGLSAPGAGVFNVALSLADVNNSEFTLRAATDITPPGSISGSGLTGMSLLDCNAFTAPPGSQTLTPGAPAFNVSSGILDVPSVLFSGKEFSLRMQYQAGSNPMRFSLMSFTEVTSGTGVPVNSITQFGGSLITEPSQDFIPLCHGWVLIGDTSRNALVERNVISGETGAIYKFNTIPDQMLLDADAGVVYMTTHPASERMYQLDIQAGAFTYHLLREGGRRFVPKDLALGENGDIFTLLFDPRYELEADPPAEEGLWMGIFNRDGDPEVPAIPLLSPVRIEYDPVKRHIFLATESNLVTFIFDPLTQDIAVVPGTDIPVGNACTDFSISPDGERLAYSCPGGNEPNPHTSIVDMDPLDYYDSDGEWFLEHSPVSATFDQSGQVLIATDGVKLYYFDTAKHLLHDSYDLGLPNGEVVKKVRLSRDGKLVLVFIESGINAKSGKIYWVPMPSFVPL